MSIWKNTLWFCIFYSIRKCSESLLLKSLSFRKYFSMHQIQQNKFCTLYINCRKQDFANFGVLEKYFILVIMNRDQTETKLYFSEWRRKGLFSIKTFFSSHHFSKIYLIIRKSFDKDKTWHRILCCFQKKFDFILNL